MAWQLDDEDLDDGAVTGHVRPGARIDAPERVQTDARLHALPVRAILGRDRAKHALTLEFIGPAPDRLQRAHYFREIMLTEDVVKLEAPPAPNGVYWNDGDKVVYLAVDSVTQPYETGLGSVRLEVVADEATAAEWTP